MFYLLIYNNKNMFEALNDLMDKLLKVEVDFSKYKNAKEARKFLQSIKQEAQALRFKITNSFKEAKTKE